MSAIAEAPPRQRAARAHERARRDRLAGPVRNGRLLAVCGLLGGAGATTLAFLIALAAARQLETSVLVADTGGPTGALSAIAGVEAPRSLPELAAELGAGGTPGGGIYAQAPGGVRVLAGGPEFTSTCPQDALRRVLADARAAHGLTVVDCGTLSREIDRTIAAAASHVARVIPASAHGIKIGTRALRAAPAVPGKELLVARRDIRQSKAALSDLRRLAAERTAPLVLVPHLARVESEQIERVPPEAQVALQAILGALAR